MTVLKGKKLLVLGGKPMGSVELVQYAQKMGLYVIVADYLDASQSPAKAMANEAWQISTADLHELAEKSKTARVDAVVSGVHDFNIRQSIRLAQMLRLPSYCSLADWDSFGNKSRFKQLCSARGLDVAREFSYEEIVSGRVTLDLENMPLICKPVDGSGSQGFSICRSKEDLHDAVKRARRFSGSKTVLIEEYIPHESLVAYFTLIDGEPILTGLADKYPKRFPGSDARIASLHIYPSFYANEFRQEICLKIQDFVREIGLREGSLWIEIFKNENRYVINEAGYRFSGSLSYYQSLVQHGVNQLGGYIFGAITGDYLPLIDFPPLVSKCISQSYKYGILPLQIRPGKIKEVGGLVRLLDHPRIIALPTLHGAGDVIEEWNSCKQTFGYLHFTFNDQTDFKAVIGYALDTLSVTNDRGENLLYTLFDPERDVLRSLDQESL